MIVILIVWILISIIGGAGERLDGVNIAVILFCVFIVIGIFLGFIAISLIIPVLLVVLGVAYVIFSIFTGR